MRYAILDLDLTNPLPTVSLTDGNSGLAVLVRRGGRPQAFFMRRLGEGTELSPEELGRLVSEHCGRDLLTAAIADELRGARESPPDADLTVAVCTHDRPTDLRDCLTSLLRLRGDGPSRFELLVVDNAPSTDATRRIVDELGVGYVREDAPGLDIARNRALREASSAYVAFVDDDTVADHGWLAGFREAVSEQPDAAVVTGLVLPFELETISQILFERHGGFRRGFRKLRYAGPRLPDNPLYPLGAGIFGAGANMVVRKDVVLALGGFDEALDTGPPLPGGGDLDIFYRVLRAGHALAYEPRMLVFHKHRRGYRQRLRQYRSWGTGLMAFLEKTRSVDPEQRENVRRMLRWWFGYQLQELERGIRRRGTALPDQVLAELAGGLIGLTRSYRRSRRRVHRQRRSR